jgi:MFS family permease
MHIVVSLIGLTVSLHIAGMYALAPLFGWLSDRIGSIGVILIGQAMFIVSLVLNWSLPESMPSIVISLILLGTGWSAATVAGATMLTGVLDPAERPKVQGVSDTVMSFGGALAGIAAGPLLTIVGFQNLNVAAGVMVVATLLMLSIVAWRKKNATTA